MSVPVQFLDADFVERLESLPDPFEPIDQPASEPARAINGSTDRRKRVAGGE